MSKKLLIEVGGTYVTRDGRHVAVTEIVTTPDTTYPVRGYVENANRWTSFTLDGRYDVYYESPDDIVARLDKPENKGVKMKETYTFIYGDDGITVYVDGNSYTASKNHPNYAKIVSIIKKGKPKKKLLKAIDTTEAVKDYCKGDINIKNGALFYKDEEIRNSLTLKILRMMDEGFDIDPMVNFFKHLEDNPSRTARQELYDFLEAGNLPITEDGFFLAYKSVRPDYRDYHTGTIDNSVGQTVTMDRGKVCDNREITCSDGLHFAQKEYAINFGSRSGHLMVLKINPADVVSIPKDYRNQKGRCCKYEVIDEVPNDGSKTYVDESVVFSYE